ncbi:outer membrane lipoprotein-sorting protein [candidate division WOR-3 bacterium]|nr:outer membrane lipoprotein-sorting protein [candidate division WOR-3 bacterium]
MKIKIKNTCPCVSARRQINALMIGMIVLLIFVLPLGAQELTGDEILKKEEENRADSEITVSEMTIVHKSGAKRIREIKAWMKGDDYTLVKFLSPANVKGTGFLSVKDDDWLYLPALGKVRRIATKEKGGSFMGSDFSYDDVGSGSWVEDYNAGLLSIEKYEKRDCYVLELIPKEPEDKSYSKLKRWVDKENFYSMKTEYYDIHGDLFKIMYPSKFENIEEFWIPKRIEMRNVQKGSKTIIVIKEVQLNPEIPDKIFTTRQLERK